jgi:hypothetical protein
MCQKRPSIHLQIQLMEETALIFHHWETNYQVVPTEKSWCIRKHNLSSQTFFIPKLVSMSLRDSSSTSWKSAGYQLRKWDVLMLEKTMHWKPNVKAVIGSSILNESWLLQLFPNAITWLSWDLQALLTGEELWCTGPMCQWKFDTFCWRKHPKLAHCWMGSCQLR